MSPQDDYLDSLTAQVAYRLSRGDSWADIMAWFRDYHGGEPLSNLYESQAEAEVRAERARTFGNLANEDQLGYLLGIGGNPFDTIDIRFNVNVPTSGGQQRWLSIVVHALGTWTKAEAKAEARRQAEAKAAENGERYGVSEEQYDVEDDVIQIGGIVLR